MQALPEYDYVVVNADLATAAAEISAIFLAEQRRVHNLRLSTP
jgi:guanylate kinase